MRFAADQVMRLADRLAALVLPRQQAEASSCAYYQSCGCNGSLRLARCCVWNSSFGEFACGQCQVVGVCYW